MTAWAISPRQDMLATQPRDVLSLAFLAEDALAWTGLRHTNLCLSDKAPQFGVAFARNPARTDPFFSQSLTFSASHSQQVSPEESEEIKLWSNFFWAMKVAQDDLPLLVSARPADRKSLFQRILTFSDPIAVTLVAFQEYQRTSREAYLLHAVSVLESWGASAWPALLWIAQLGRAECELFTGLIARCPGVAEADRLKALVFLAANPDLSALLFLNTFAVFLLKK